MDNQIVITGAVGPRADLKALQWLADCVAEIQPAEIVCIEGSTELLDRLREVYDGPIGVHSGSAETSHRVIELPAVYGIAPGWISTHVEDARHTSPVPGNTALNAAKRFGKSVVLGHTGQMGIGSHSTGSEGTTVTGVEVGHLGRRPRARSTARDWQQGFGLLAVDGEAWDVQPRTHPVRNL